MIEQVLHCDVEDCAETLSLDKNDVGGLPRSWGVVTFRQYLGDTQSQEVTKQLCPNHLEIVKASAGVTFPPPPEK